MSQKGRKRRKFRENDENFVIYDRKDCGSVKICELYIILAMRYDLSDIKDAAFGILYALEVAVSSIFLWSFHT